MSQSIINKFLEVFKTEKDAVFSKSGVSEFWSKVQTKWEGCKRETYSLSEKRGKFLGRKR